MDMTALQNAVLGALGQRGRVFRFLGNVLKDQAMARSPAEPFTFKPFMSDKDRLQRCDGTRLIQKRHTYKRLVRNPPAKTRLTMAATT